jgi:hypothetical protein
MRSALVLSLVSAFCHYQGWDGASTGFGVWAALSAVTYIIVRLAIAKSLSDARKVVSDVVAKHAG